LFVNEDGRAQENAGNGLFIPLSAPPQLVGTLLVVSVTLGYLATDKLIAAKFTTKGQVILYLPD
jgi:hypothetical protein